MARRQFKDRSKWDRESTWAFAAILTVFFIALLAVIGIMFLIPVETG